MALLMPMVNQEVDIDWLTVTLKYDNHGGRSNICSLAGSSGRRLRDRACAYIGNKLDLTDG